jgi:hypothetical protein
MQLSSQEIKAFRNIEKRRRVSKSVAWGYLVAGCVLFGYGMGAEPAVRYEVSLPVVLILVAFFQLSSMYFDSASNERLERLLKKYVHGDAEALSQINQASNGEPAK